MSTVCVFILLVVFTGGAFAKSISVNVRANVHDTIVAYAGGRESLLAECYAMSEYIYHDSSNFRAFQENWTGGFWYDIEFTPRSTGVFRDTIIAHWGWGMSRCGDPRDDRDTIYVEGIATDTVARVESFGPEQASLNFVDGRLELRLSRQEGWCRIAILDVLGRTIYLCDLFIVEGFASVRMPTGIPEGTYYIEISGEPAIIGRFALTR